MSASPQPAMLRIMPREMRIMSERILTQTALPSGFVPPIVDLPMYSQMMGLGGLNHLLDRFETIKSSNPDNIAILREADGAMAVDCGGEHAWIAIPTLIDLLRELVVRFSTARIEIANVTDAAELAAAEGFGNRFGLDITCSDGPEPALEAVASAKGSTDDPVLRDALENGALVPETLWWRFYDLAKKALATDTVVSRRHAGPVMVTEDGKVIGRLDNDDDTDIDFLLNPPAGDE